MFICTHVQPYFQLKTLMDSQVGGETVIRNVFKKRKTCARGTGTANAHPAINSGECPRGGANSGRRKRSRQLAHAAQHLANSEVAWCRMCFKSGRWSCPHLRCSCSLLWQLRRSLADGSDAESASMLNPYCSRPSSSESSLHGSRSSCSTAQRTKHRRLRSSISGTADGGR